jgi:hypothetical protein
MTTHSSSAPYQTGPALAWAWILMVSSWAWWLVLANAFAFLAHAYVHAPHTPDPAHGFTHLMNNHGDIRYVRESDQHASTRWTLIGGAGLAVSVGLLLIFVKAPTVRHILIRRGAILIPVLITAAMGLYWQGFAK